jgi:hypothetical protein
MKKLDLVGQKYGRLTVKALVGRATHGQALWLCLCDCGIEKVINHSHLRSGNTKSCGCLNTPEARSLSHIRHGMSYTPEWTSFHAAKKRCTNPKSKSFKDYGGRGIEFRFQSFEEFFAEVGPRPEPKFLYSLERIDNDGHYECGNVRWATKKQQARNRRCDNCVNFATLELRVTELEKRLAEVFVAK